VPGPSWIALVLLALPHSLSACIPGLMLAYVGLGPGQEFIPYFFGMVAWAGAAFLAILQWPIIALWRRLSRPQAHDDRSASAPAPAEKQESAGEGSAVRR
jgi:hypothetical protein